MFLVSTIFFSQGCLCMRAREKKLKKVRTIFLENDLFKMNTKKILEKT